MNSADSAILYALARDRGSKVQGNLPASAKPPRKRRGTGRVSQAKRAFAAVVVAIPPGTRVITIPLRTVSELNSHTHWRHRQARAKRQREIAALFVRRMDLPQQMPVSVRLVRIGKRLLDSDAVDGSLKHVRDGIADVFGVDDGSPLYRWEYGQEVGREYGVRIELSEAKA